MPEAVLCDNAFGAPSCPGSRGGSWFESRLRWLGIRPSHGRPYHPQTQGKVERWHGTLVRRVYPRLDTGDLNRFTVGWDRWRHGVYNVLGPHEALGDQAPITLWRPGSRPVPTSYPRSRILWGPFFAGSAQTAWSTTARVDPGGAGVGG